MKRRDDFSWHSTNSYYCEEHRKLQETYWKIVRNYDTNPESLSSSHDGQLTNDASSDRRRRRRSIVEQNRDSPVASCLKTVGKKSEVKKRVNFYKERAETTSYSSSSYYRLPQNNIHSRRPSSHRSTANNDDDSYNSISTDLYDLQCSSSGSPGHPRAHASPSRKASKTDDSSNEERRLLERLSELSLHSPSNSSSIVTCCSSRKKPEPRLYRPKDCLKRPAVRRMLVYPPEGQTGPPLTLRRSWSNIDCQVTGDPTNGYRYKVYYLQKFESDSWFPDDKTGSPFRRLEDDCSTDYG